MNPARSRGGWVTIAAFLITLIIVGGATAYFIPRLKIVNRIPAESLKNEPNATSSNIALNTTSTTPIQTTALKNELTSKESKPLESESKITYHGKSLYPEFKGSSISFQYPKNWYLKPEIGEFFISNLDTKLAEDNMGIVYIQSHKNYLLEDPSLRQYYASDTFTKTTFKGYPAYETTVTEPAVPPEWHIETPDKTTEIFVEVDQTIWSIRYQADVARPDLYATAKEIVDSIVFK